MVKNINPKMKIISIPITLYISIFSICTAKHIVQLGKHTYNEKDVQKVLDLADK